MQDPAGLLEFLSQELAHQTFELGPGDLDVSCASGRLASGRDERQVDVLFSMDVDNSTWLSRRLSLRRCRAILSLRRVDALDPFLKLVRQIG